MYVKVTFGKRMGGDFLLELPRKTPIHSGSYAIPFDPDARDHDIAGGLGKAIAEDIEGEAQTKDHEDSQRSFFAGGLHVLEIEQHQTQYEANKGLLVVKAVWWTDPEDGMPHGVVTTRNIFLQGDDGRTIERVR